MKRGEERITQPLSFFITHPIDNLTVSPVVNGRGRQLLRAKHPPYTEFTQIPTLQVAPKEVEKIPRGKIISVPAPIATQRVLQEITITFGKGATGVGNKQVDIIGPSATILREGNSYVVQSGQKREELKEGELLIIGTADKPTQTIPHGKAFQLPSLESPDVKSAQKYAEKMYGLASRSHAVIGLVRTAEGYPWVIIEDLGSMNGTYLSYQRSTWSYTQDQRNMLGITGVTPLFSDFLAENGITRQERDEIEKLGYPLITRDSGINKHTYAVNNNEVIFIDDSKDKKLKAVGDRMSAVIDEGRRHQRTHSTEQFIQLIYNMTRREIPYNKPNDIKLSSKNGRLLGDYFGRGATCAKQALLIGYLGEKAIAEKIVDGKFYVQKNIVDLEEEQGGHSWVKYVSPTGEITIIDPAQQYIGPVHKTGQWFYDEPIPF